MSMLKNKGVIFVLLLAVGYVWYQVFYRIKDNFFSENTAPLKTEKKYTEGSFSIERDTTPLLVNYSDPFSKQFVLSNTNTTTNQPTVEPMPKPIEKKYVEWPEIRYFGFLKSNQSKQPLAILKINGEFFYVRNGDDLFDGFIVKNVSKECIWIKYYSETKKVCL